MNKTNKGQHKMMMRAIMLSSMLIGLIIGMVVGIDLYQVVSNKVGYWKGTVQATEIIILSLRHQIQSSDRIRTTIQLGNTGGSTISCNCTLYYKATGDVDLATYSFNTTINAGQTYSRAFSVQPINVSRWIGTDTSIYEY
jgi:hypothetical protein